MHYWHFSSPDHQPDSSSVQVARCFLGELRFHSEKRPLSLHCCIQDTWPSGKGITQTEIIYTITVPTKGAHYSAEKFTFCHYLYLLYLYVSMKEIASSFSHFLTKSCHSHNCRRWKEITGPERVRDTKKGQMVRYESQRP